MLSMKPFGDIVAGHRKRAATTGRRFLVLAAFLALPLLAGGKAELSQIRNVYLLPMGNGFDQYLAGQLTRKNVFQVVTDPQKADAVFTGEIGRRFEKALEKLYPPPPEPEPEVSKEETSKESDTEATGETGTTEEQTTNAEEVQQKPPEHISTFGRGRGNVFLVRLESSNVVWSTYYRPKNFGSEELNRSAAKVVEELQAALAGN